MQRGPRFHRSIATGQEGWTCQTPWGVEQRTSQADVDLSPFLNNSFQRVHLWRAKAQVVRKKPAQRDGRPGGWGREDLKPRRSNF